MSDVETFKADLRAAGQPWSKRGVWAAGGGIICLTIAQGGGWLLPVAAYFFPILGLALVLLGLGWAFFIVAYVKRRRWAKAHPIEAVPMPELP